MWHLALFLGQYFLKGKPKKKEFYISARLSEKYLFEKKMQEIIEDPKWIIDSIHKIDIPENICYIVICKERYF